MTLSEVVGGEVEKSPRGRCAQTRAVVRVVFGGAVATLVTSGIGQMVGATI